MRAQALVRRSVRQSERESYKEVRVCLPLPVCVCVSVCGCVCVRAPERALARLGVCVSERLCVRSPPAAESRERRGTGRVGGEVMSGTRQRPTDESAGRGGGGGGGGGGVLVLRRVQPPLLLSLR